MPLTYNPIIREEELKAFSPSTPIRVAAPGRALVWSGKAALHVFRHGKGGPTRGQLFTGTYNWLFEVDVAEKSLGCDAMLQSRENIPGFRVGVQVRCTVSDPRIIVQNRTHDALAVIQPVLLAAMNYISTRHHIADLERVRQEFGYLDLDQFAKYGFALSDLMISLAHTAEAERIIAAERIKKLEHEQTLAQLQRDNEVKDEKLRRTREILSGGMERIWAEHLTDNPQDLIKIAEMMREQQKQQQELLRLADGVEDPMIKRVMIEKITGQAPELLSSSSATSASVENDEEDYNGEFQ